MLRPGKSSGPPILCYVTDRKSLAFSAAGDNRGDLLKRIAGAASAGVDWIQIREKDLCGREISLLSREAILLTERSNRQSGHATRILVNDRLDVALAERTAGVHLGEHSLPVQNVRRRLQVNPLPIASDKFLVGVSRHSVEDAISAAREGAGYIFFGPVFATPSKVVFSTPQGLERLAEVCSSVPIPVLAIGGITRENTSACLAVGAAGIAAIRLFQDAGDLASLVADLHAILR